MSITNNNNTFCNDDSLYFEDEKDEEAYLDSLYRPKKKNNRKHNLNLFVFLILKNNTSPENPMSQREILETLEKEHELVVERKSLSRAIHDIEDEQLGIVSNPKGGAWYDPNAYSIY